MGKPPGGRLVYKGEYGTVRYIGPLASQTGVWIGVQWDQPGRGKHDGVAPDGTRYFDAYVRQLTQATQQQRVPARIGAHRVGRAVPRCIARKV